MNTTRRVANAVRRETNAVWRGNERHVARSERRATRNPYNARGNEHHPIDVDKIAKSMLKAARRRNYGRLCFGGISTGVFSKSLRCEETQICI